MIVWTEDGRTLYAYRGQIVTLPTSEIERLEAHGALISATVDLDRPGVLMELPLAPSDEELVNWVMNAAPAEVTAVRDQRPELAGRLDGALRHITDERVRQDEHLASVRRAIAEGTSGVPTDAVGTPLSDADDDIVWGPPRESSTGRTDGVVEVPPHQDTAQPPETQAASELETIVRGNVEGIASYLADHPEDAQLVLDTENRLRGGEARAGVRRAVEVAATFTE
jgi:hypothetical protein